MAPSIVYRCASAQDIAAIIAMADRYYIHHLSAEARTGGYLSARFNELQLASMLAEPGVVVAMAGQQLLGFMCSTRFNDQRQPAIVQTLFQKMAQVKYRGRVLCGWKSFVYGPVCIDREFRGGGIVFGLYETLLAMVAGAFEVGVAFVAHDNPASLRAHIQKLGMTPVGDFEFDGRDYAILAFAVPGRAA